MNIKLTLLGGLTVNEFLRDYWQKKPLLIRQAVPGFKGLLDPQQLIDLACSRRCAGAPGHLSAQAMEIAL